jgi:phycocyanobilin lyase subunit alpha
MTSLDPSEAFQDASDPTDQPLTIEQAITNLSGTDYGDRYYAAWWLGRFRVRITESRRMG